MLRWSEKAKAKTMESWGSVRERETWSQRRRNGWKWSLPARPQRATSRSFDRAMALEDSGAPAVVAHATPQWTAQEPSVYDV